MFEEDPNYQGQNIEQMKNTRFKTFATLTFSLAYI